MVGSSFLKGLYLGTTSKNRNPLFWVLDRAYNCSTDGQTKEAWVGFSFLKVYFVGNFSE